MALGFNRHNARSHQPEKIQTFQLPCGVGLARVDWRDQPRGVVEQLRVGILNSADLFASHRMSRKDKFSCGSAKDHARTLDKFSLSTTGISDQCGRGKCRREFFEQREDSPYWRSEDDDIAVRDSFLDVGATAVNCAARYGCLQHIGLVTANNRSLESALAESKSERAADQAGSN